MQRAIQRIASGELAILLLVSPLFLFARPSFAPVLSLLPLLWLARRHSRGHFIPRTPVDWPILGLLIMALVGIWATPDLPFSFRKIAGLLYGIALFYAIVDWGQRQASLLPTTLLVIFVASGTAVLSLLGTQWLTKLPVMADLLSHLPLMIRGLPGAESGFNPNRIGSTMILFVPLQLLLLPGGAAYAGLSRARRCWLKIGLGLSLLLTGAVLLLSQSRLAWAALILGLIGIAGVAVRQLRLVAVALIAAVMVVSVAFGPADVGEWLVRQGWMASSGEVSWLGRVEVWSRALWAIADFPLTGTGLDMFRRLAGPSYPLFVFPHGHDVGHAHNTYLQVALDLGLPGLVCYLALLGTVLVAGWQSHKRACDRLVSTVALGGTAGLATHAAWGMADALPLGTRADFFWWVLLALVVTVALRSLTQGQGDTKAARS